LKIPKSGLILLYIEKKDKLRKGTNMGSEHQPPSQAQIITPSSPKFIEGMIEEWSSFTPATRALDGLTGELATTKLEGWPHSIAEVVAHMLFWQRHDFETIETGSEPKVNSLSESFPPVQAQDWDRLKNEFLTALEHSRELARDQKNLKRLILGNQFSVGARMIWFTGHNAYHLGQIVLMRRILGAWPPPGGGMGWE
jgi:uncharacterized damage-inducible protein DinB